MGWAVNDRRLCTWRTSVETLFRWCAALASVTLLLLALAGCSREDDEDRQQAVYRAAPVPTVQPAVPREGGQRYARQIPYQQGQQAIAPRYQPQDQYQPQYQPGPQFEIDDSGNPWGYRPTPQLPPPASQTVPQQQWVQPGYPFSSGAEQQRGTMQRFGGYRPLESDEAAKKRRRRRDYAEQPGMPPPEPYYPSQVYPYGGAPYGGAYDPYAWARGGYPYGFPYGGIWPGW